MRCFRLAVSTCSVIPIFLAASLHVGESRLWCAEKAPDGSVIKLLLPEEFVIAYPALVSIVVPRFPEAAYGITLPPLAHTLGQREPGGVGIQLNMSRENGTDGLSVGSVFYGIPDSERRGMGVPTGDGGRWVKLQPGDAYFTTLDVYQLPFYSRVDNELQVVRVDVGDWRVGVRLSVGGVDDFHWFSVRIRKPTEAEEEVASALRTKGLGQSWFPQVVLSDDPVPDCDHLPLETRRIVRLIGVLRAARRSCQGGLDLIQTYESTETWGYLQGLIDFVEYECAAELGETGWATAKRNQILEGADTNANIQEIDAGRGVIGHFRKLKAELMPTGSEARE